MDEENPIEDQLLLDKIIQGMRDPKMREMLYRIKKLTLEKTIDLCISAEHSKKQVTKFESVPTDPSINSVKFKNKNQGQNRSHSSNNKSKGNTGNKMPDIFQCRRCQTQHGPRQCPAYGKKCSKCGLLNHFAVSCRVKNVKSVESKAGPSDNASENDSALSTIFQHRYFVFHSDF